MSTQDALSRTKPRVFGDPILRTKAADVTRFDDELDDELLHLATKMANTMWSLRRSGLAAPQVGVSKRLFVFESNRFESSQDVGVLCNAEVISASSDTVEQDEGCLSIPGHVFPVARAKEIRVQAFRLDGNPMVFEAHGFLARVLQHEIDHTNGILLIDHLAPEARKHAMRQLRPRA